jgi:hypothetical protein
MVWIPLCDALADKFFGLAVGHRHRRVVRFEFGLHAGLEVAQGQAAGVMGCLDGKGQEFGKGWLHVWTALLLGG